VKVIEIPEASKTSAFNAAELAVSSYPRFFLDADVVVPINIFAELSAILNGGEADLVAPRIAFDATECSWAAGAIADVWSSLPHAHDGAFHHLLGVNAEGRKSWGLFPEIIADDTFIETCIPKDRQRVVSRLTVTTWPPQNYRSWIRTRARWAQGQRQLVAKGIGIPRVVSQRRVLISRLFNSSSCLPTMVYLSARVCAIPLGWWYHRHHAKWFRNRH
jgi:hypothetical protein